MLDAAAAATRGFPNELNINSLNLLLPNLNFYITLSNASILRIVIFIKKLLFKKLDDRIILITKIKPSRKFVPSQEGENIIFLSSLCFFFV